MRRVGLVFVVAAAILPVAVSRAAPAAHAATGTKLQLHQSGLGEILVNGRGFTVYVFTHDSRRRDTCVTLSGCTSVWPPTISHGRLTLGQGVRRSRVGTITLPNGTRQLTYAGHPLYTYAADAGPAQTAYVGVEEFGGTWYALGASGGIVK